MDFLYYWESILSTGNPSGRLLTLGYPPYLSFFIHFQWIYIHVAYAMPFKIIESSLSWKLEIDWHNVLKESYLMKRIRRMICIKIWVDYMQHTFSEHETNFS